MFWSLQLSGQAREPNAHRDQSQLEVPYYSGPQEEGHGQFEVDEPVSDHWDASRSVAQVCPPRAHGPSRDVLTSSEKASIRHHRQRQSRGGHCVESRCIHETMH